MIYSDDDGVNSRFSMPLEGIDIIGEIRMDKIVPNGKENPSA